MYVNEMQWTSMISGTDTTHTTHSGIAKKTQKRFPERRKILALKEQTRPLVSLIFHS